MSQTFSQLWQAEPLQAAGMAALVFCLYVLASVLPGLGLLYLGYFLLTLPLRRNERTRLLLDLLALGLKEGRSPELTLVGVLSSRDPALGVRLHLLAAHLEQGLRLSEALQKVPRVVPPSVRSMLQVGERIGDVGKVLPACRLCVQDSVSQVRGALNYVVVMGLAITPLMLLVPLLLRIKVLPVFEQVFASMTNSSTLPPFTQLVFGQSLLLLGLEVGLVAFLWLLLLAYVGGPRLAGWVEPLWPGLLDRLACWLPWRRKRLQRNFSAMLAVLLDGGVPESEAVGLAAEATANRLFRRRALQAQQLLSLGVKLPEALRVIDEAGELRWRLANALHRGGGFLRALGGWHQALDAKAFQLEQAAAQLTTTLLVLFNGLLVACIVIGLFLALIQLLNQAILW